MLAPIAGGAGRLSAGATRTVTLAVLDVGGRFGGATPVEGRPPGVAGPAGVDR